jgi:hypothetical protein
LDALIANDEPAGEEDHNGLVLDEFTDDEGDHDEDEDE